MKKFFNRIFNLLSQSALRTDSVAVPITSAGFDGLCYFEQRRINWEALGASTGILGAFLLALNSGYQGYGWLAFLASNLCWISFALINRFKMLFWQQIAFLITTLIGLYNAFGLNHGF